MSRILFFLRFQNIRQTQEDKDINKAFFFYSSVGNSCFSKLGDERLEEVEEHEDSIYSCAWAGNDPWIFASVSFDGRVIVSRVKRHHKYAILRL